MSFFSGRPRVGPQEPEPERVQPEWFGPPRGVLPGYDSQRAVVFRTDDAILVIGKFDVYPTGATFSIDLQLRSENYDFEHMPWELHHRGTSMRGIPDDLIRLGIVFADGSSWSNLDARFASFDAAPPAPFVIARGGGGGGNSWSMEQWLWPLPPDGPLTLIAEWPSYGIAETRAVIDATALRVASSNAIDLWS